jgi:hypothetical protein
MDETTNAATYANLFPEQLVDRCSPDALESNSGPVAYLHQLYHQALKVENASTADSRITLTKRRPDIGELLVSKEALEKQIPPLTLVIRALTRQAQSHVGADKRLPEQINQSLLCTSQPFHYPLEQIQAVLKQKKLPLFELLQRTEYSFPNFCYGRLRTELFRQVMRAATGFSPALQQILLNDAKSSDADFLKQRFGTTESDGAKQITQLVKVEFFCRSTGLNTDQVYDLLAVSGVPDNAAEGFTSVRRASAYPGAQSAVLGGHLYGAAFINNGKTAAMTLKDTLTTPGLTLEIANADAARFARIYKLIQLQRALKLTFAETDLLLMSALRAEGQTKDFHITPNTLRALGVFRFFNETYEVSAEQFSALIHEVSPYALGDQVPFLDRVLAGPGDGKLADIDDRLIIDDTEFDPGDGAEHNGDSLPQSIMGRLCRALGMNERLANDYLAQVTTALGVQKPNLSLALVSSLYRLSRLPRLMRLSLDEGASLIALLALGNADVSTVLGGKPKISDEDDKPDILDVLMGLANMQRWLHGNDLSARRLLMLLTPLPTNPPQELELLYGVGPQVRNTLNNALPQVRASLLSAAKIKKAVGTVGRLKTDDWPKVLDSFLTAEGVVKPPATDIDGTLSVQLQAALLDKLQDDDQKATVATILESMLLNARIAQEDISCHIISTALGDGTEDKSLSPNHALALLRWIDASPTKLLTDLLTAAASDGLATEQTAIPLRNISFNLWAKLARGAQVIQWMQLSPAGLIALLNHPQWFDFEEQDSSENSGSLLTAELNLDFLYQLTRYREWVNICRANNFDECDALSYLSSLPESDEPGAISAATERLSKLIGWQSDETLQAAPRVTITTPISSPPAKGSLDEYLATLTASERSYYNYCDRTATFKGLGVLIMKYHQNGKTYPNADALYAKFARFIDNHSGTLKVEAKDYLPDTEPAVWTAISTQVKSAKTIKLVKYDNESPKTFDDFLNTLTADERAHYEKPKGGIWSVLANYHWIGKDKSFAALLQSIHEKFKRFLAENPGPLKVTNEQYQAGYKPKTWEANRKIREKDGVTLENPKNLELEVFVPPILTAPISEDVPTIPNTVSDIDFIMRVQALCKTTGLSCQSLLNLSELDETSAYQQFHTAGQLLIGACSDEERNIIEGRLQELWRNALLGYLMGYWVPSAAGLQDYLPTVDDLSSYFLADIGVSSEARKTTEVSQAIASLQHYLHRLFSHLEPGYDSTELLRDGSDQWHHYLSQYGTWSRWRAQINHPENLIYYANRPRKSAAFQELEVEVNQGRLDEKLLHNAVCNYLTKFERLSNLQVVSGYLDGSDPKNNTYHLIGKTNTSPAEYFWRSVDMGLRDDKERISPLAWTEWEKIGIPASGEICVSTYSTPNKVAIASCDAIRPVIIAGRRYIFWVERGQTGLPSSDEKNQTPTKYKKLSVQYAYQQSDGFWSTANELICLDGKKDGVRLKVEDNVNNYLKDDSYIPGLIAFVNIEGERAEDPWLTVIMYDCSEKSLGDIDNVFFMEMRDLLLIKKQSPSSRELEIKLAKTAYTSYKDIRNIQHTFNGAEKTISLGWVEYKETYLLPDDATQWKDPAVNYVVVTPRVVDPLSIDINVSNTSNMLEKEFIFTEISVYVTTPDGVKHLLHKQLDMGLTHQYSLLNYTYRVKENGKYAFEIILAKSGLYYRTRFTASVQESLKDEHWNISIKQDINQAQYLDLSSVSAQEPKFDSNFIRLNTLFGKNLVARATESVERALGWETQMLTEPTIDEKKPNPPVDFHGANGMYFRELFLHLPAFIASRLTEQQQFEDAEAWYLRYLFDPYRTHKGEGGRTPYWNTRPLAEAGSLSSKLRMSVDPSARAFILSRYYRQAVFLSLVENWQRQGDHYYRQLTMSALSHAWLCYQQALKLMGPLPGRTAASRWKDARLSEVSDKSFLAPVNQWVTDVRKTLERRLHNLRHGLTLDGKTLPNLGWRDEVGDPFASAKGGLSIVASSYNSNRASIPAYRFRQLLPAARTAAQQLLDLGRHYMKLMEDEFNKKLSVLLKAQEIRISDFTLRLQNEAINAVVAQKRLLELGLQATEARKAWFEQLLETGVSPSEVAAIALKIGAKAFTGLAIPFEIAAGFTAGLTPTIYGMAIGGNKPEQPMARTATASRLASSMLDSSAEMATIAAGYQRRESGWKFELQQAEWDLLQIKQQLVEIDTELNIATIGLDATRQERKNLEEAYVAMTTGFTIIPIYNWLVARQQLLYGAAYDAVLSMCLSLEAAWRYEIGDYSREAFIKTSAWSDSYKGMLAGESLLVDLQEMENAYLLANERRLTIKKSFGLKEQLGESNWKTSIKNLSECKPVLFEFKASDFDKNYPGHYLRQLKHVSVTFELNGIAELNGLSAILTQTSNSTLVEPSAEGATYLYKGGQTPPESIKRNLRAQQQIALSSLVSEDGLGYSPGEWVYELMFHDGRYLPFEGTGVISQWQLEVPDEELAKALTKGSDTAVTNIHVNLVYTSLDGGPDLIKKINELRTLVKT